MSRRKRRSQPKRGKFNPLYVVLITCGLLLAALVVALMVARSALDKWITGEGFRTWVVQKAGDVLKSEVQLDSLKWEGTSSVYGDRFLANGYEGAGFAILQLDGVRAVNGGVSGGAFKIPEVTVNRMNLEFSPKRIDAPREYEKAPEITLEQQGIPSWLAKYVPNRVEVDEVRISTANVEVKGADGKRTFALQSVRGRIEPDFQTSIWEIEGSGGKIFIEGQPEIQLKELSLGWKGKDLYIKNGSFGVFKKGHVQGLGEMHFEDDSFDFDLEVSGIDTEEVLEGTWKERLSGTLRGPVKVQGKPGDLTYSGTIHLEDGLLENLPVLELVAKYTRSKRFNPLPLNETKADFTWKGDLIELRNIVIQSDGLVRVEGKLDMRGEVLDGDLQVGVTPGTLRWIPGAERKVFTQEREGFLWADMNLAGTIKQPKENLSPKLIAAAGEAILQDLPAGTLNEVTKMLGVEGVGGEGQTGEATSEAIKEQSKQILNLLGPLLQGR